MKLFFKKLKKKEDRINKYIVMKYKKKKLGMSFVDQRSFKTNKRVILFCRELVSRSRNLNQHKSRNLLETERHFNVEVRIYYFNPIFKFQVGVFFTVKKEITNFLFSIYYFNPIFKSLVN